MTKRPPDRAAPVSARALAAASVPLPLPGGNSVTQPIEGGPAQVVMTRPDGLKPIGGSNYEAFNSALLGGVLAAMRQLPPEGTAERVVAASAALAAFRPVDEVEAMIAAQAVALHHGAMECLRRAMLPGQQHDVASKLRKDGANLARSMADMLDALDRKRGRGPQVVRVERVVVHEGGQAIVGDVHPRAAPTLGQG